MDTRQYFTHLHLHTDYSLLDGAITIDKLVEFGKTQKRPALGISDHGNIFGAVKFFQKCKKAGIKPVLGMESYFTEDASIKNSANRYYHLMLLVKNKQGYKNLCKLIAFSYQQGFYFKPRIDYNILKEHSEGLICTSACLGSHINQLLLAHNDQEALERIDWFLKVFGEDNFYLEVHPPQQPEQIIVNDKLYEISKTKGIPLLAAADCHYPQKEDREAHEILLSIQTSDTIDNPDRFTFGECLAYMRTEAEMLEIFKEHPDAVWNSGRIADSCTFEFEFGKLFFPQSPIPEGEQEVPFFEKQCRAGLEHLFDTGRIDKSERERYVARLDEEMALIEKMGFVGYLLVVCDFVQWAHAHNIPVGPGRGSAAGSLVVWALRITDIDPLKYNLLFERFLNPERISMPDIDIDFCIEGRERVINYVKDKYGHANVCQIVTFGTMLAKGVIKDVARALGVSYDEAQMMSNLIPEQLKITLTEAFEKEEELRKLRNHPRLSKVFDVAFKLEGITRHASKHACGIVISPAPIDEVLPVYIPPKTDELVAQYAMSELEALGFLKMDFLGLKNLTLIQRALELIVLHRGEKIAIEHIPLDDPGTFELLCKGLTSGVFQLESSGLKDVLRRLQPEGFEDIIAVNALYRPGPLGSGMVDDFIERRHGRAKISYLFPELEPVLKDTYGVIVYQEQVMKIASTIAGYSLGEADILRRAMGKKKAEVMAEQKNIFSTRSVGRGFDKQKAEELFDLMAYFAGYGFNKSHSAAYALIAYQTAYLKTHYTPEFLSCLISLESSDPEKQAFYIQEAKDQGITILPPDINKSEQSFSVEQGQIRFGLRGIKNVGDAALINMIEERKAKSTKKDAFTCRSEDRVNDHIDVSQNGECHKKPFMSLYDFAMRVDLRTCNKRVFESLIAAGAFDFCDGNRAQKLAEIGAIIERASEERAAKETGQLGLFDFLSGSAVQGRDKKDVLTVYTYAPLEDFSLQEKLNKEKDVLGLYVSAQPCDIYKRELSWLKTQSFVQLAEHKIVTGVVAAGSLLSSKVILTKKGDKMAFVSCEDSTSKAEIILFPKTYAKAAQYLDGYSYYVIMGDAESQNEKCKIKANMLLPLDLLFEHTFLFQSVGCNFGPDKKITKQDFLDMKELFTPGDTPLEVSFYDNGKPFTLKAKGKIAVTKELLINLENRFGASVSIQL
ncbi:MAG: polymerase III, alpha subunit protein [candidate division TM6 bacterium GW2011_GWE2_41_16]|nr:MAG: polymerase III, alpha subunit protein [candidate division TM6 bacterium GW2011_GWE2_41_16]